MGHVYKAGNIHCTTVHSCTMYCCHDNPARPEQPHFARFDNRRRSLRSYFCFSSAATPPAIRKRLNSVTVPDKNARTRGENCVKEERPAPDVMKVVPEFKHHVRAPLLGPQPTEPQTVLELLCELEIVPPPISKPELATESQPVSMSELATEQPVSVSELATESQPVSMSELATEQPVSVPELATEPKPVSMSELATEQPVSVPELATESQPVSISELATEPQPVSISELATEPKPVSISELATGPKLVSVSELATEQPISVSQLATKPKPVLVSELATEPKPVSMSELATEQPVSVSELATEPQPVSMSELATEPQPVSMSELATKPQPVLVSEQSTLPQPVSVSKLAAVNQPLSVSELSEALSSVSLSELATLLQPVSAPDLTPVSKPVSKLSTVTQPVSVNLPVPVINVSVPVVSVPSTPVREHIFVEYGKEIKRVVTPPLPIPLEKLLDKIISTFGDTLTADMVPLKALYIQDAQTKIFYQLDDQNDVVKGSHLRLHEELVIKNIDRGSSQSLEDLNNSSNSSLSSGGGFVIPATTNPVSLPTKPAKRPGKSRLSLVEERLSLITHEINTIHKSDTCSEVSSQTDLPVVMADPKNSLSHLHTIIRTLYQNLKDTKSELMLLKRRELESRAEMDAMVRTTTEEITRHIEAAMPRGIRGERIEADKVEADYRKISEETYANIKDLERTVDVLKSDVVKRKVRLDPVQLESMEKELQSYTEKVSHMNSTFDTLKESLKKVMKEELEIIVNEEQFLEDEEPMLEDATVKCEELERVVETLKKVATMQQEKGSNPLSIYTASEYDIMEERHGVMQAIAALVPNHDERVQSIQETEEIRAVQKKFQKSESDFVAEEIQFKSQNLRKTNAFEELEKKRDDALKAMYTAQPPPHRFGRKTSQPQFVSTAVERKVSISKCKSMSSIGNNEEDSRHFKYSVTDSDGDGSPPPSANQLSSQSAVNIKRSQSFNKEKDKQHSSEDEKSKKKTVFGFFSKKSKSNSKHDDSKHKDNHHSTENHVGSNGDVFVVDTANIKDSSNPPSPAIIPRSYTEGSRKNLPKSRSKTDRTLSVNFDEKSSRHKKGKSRS